MSWLKLSNKDVKKCILARTYEHDDYFTQKGFNADYFREMYRKNYGNDTKVLKNIDPRTEFYRYNGNKFILDTKVTETSIEFIHKAARCMTGGYNPMTRNLCHEDFVNDEVTKESFMRGTDNYLVLDIFDQEKIVDPIPHWGTDTCATQRFLCVYQNEEILHLVMIYVIVDVHDEGVCVCGGDQEIIISSPLSLTDTFFEIPSLVDRIVDKFGVKLLLKSIPD